MKTGIEIITEERERQIREEGFTPEKDQEYTHNELARAAATYAFVTQLKDDFRHGYAVPSQMWPWRASWWKPTPDNRIKELAKAGALIAAEIDRLQNKPKK